MGGAVSQVLLQGENPSAPSRQAQETLRVRTYTVPAGTGGWWKLNYTYNGGTPSRDLTTWAVSVEGGPVHLVNG